MTKPEWNFEDDPRLTAYALGELADGAERAEVEALLATHADARRFVEETRALASTLTSEMGVAPVAAGVGGGAGLTEPQRVAVRTALGVRADFSPCSSSLPGSGATPRKGEKSALTPKQRPGVLRVTNWAIPARIAAVALVAVAFAERREIGRWWTGADSAYDYRDVIVEKGGVLALRPRMGTRALNAQFGAVASSETFELKEITGFGSDLATGVRRGGIGYNGGGGSGGTPTVDDYRFPDSWDHAQTSRSAPTDRNTIVEKRRALTLRPGAFRSPPNHIRAITFDDLFFGTAEARARLGRDNTTGIQYGTGGKPLEPSRFREAGGGGGTLATWGTDPSAGGGNLSGSEDEKRGTTPAAELVDRSTVPQLGSGFAGGGGGGGGLEGDAPVDAVTNGLDDKATATASAPAVPTDPRLRFLHFTTTTYTDTPPDLLGEVRSQYLQSEGVFVGALYIADFDTEIAQAAAIADPLVRRAALVGIVDKAHRAEGNPAGYRSIEDNPFRNVADSPLSTFGADVDTASYSNLRRFLNAGTLPPPGAVRIEEMVNYFPTRYAPPTDGEPFAVHADVAGCPWDATHRLVRIGLKGREIDLRQRPQSNLVFLLDVSGSMTPENRLPLVVESMKKLVAQLDQRDKVSIVVYAGAAGTVLPPTAGDQHETILAALGRLQAGGSTAGAEGIQLAYKLAQENFVPGGTNRVILATDGDFNVGVSDDSSLVKLIEEKAASKVFLSVLGVGDDNLQDAKMEQLADKGNGNYAYLDSAKEGSKVLVEQAAGTLLTIAKDVKLQVEFNPQKVAGYRLLGYENRVLATEDFANDRKDAGDMGAGHTVTAMYEIVPLTTTAPAAVTEPLRYQSGPAPTTAALSGELFTVKLRYKQPEGDVSVLRERPVMDSAQSFDAAGPDFHFAAAVASFGMLLRGSPHKGGATLAMSEELALDGLSWDPGGHRAEFVELVRKAKALAAAQATDTPK